MSIATAVALPWLNRRIGTVNVFLLGEIFFGACMVATPFIPMPLPGATDAAAAGAPAWWPNVLFGALMGFGYATHANNPYIVGDEIVERSAGAGSGDKHRGFMTGLVNATCPAAQIVIGAAGGAIVQAAGNAHVLFAVTGGLAGAASILVLLSPTRGGMVPRGAAAASTGGQGSGV